MAWTVPLTFIAGAGISAAQLNSMLVTNMNETMPAKATSANQFFSTSGINSLVQRNVAATEITDFSFTNVNHVTSSTYGNSDQSNFTNPSLSVSTGSKALVFWSLQMSIVEGSFSTSDFLRASMSVSGATTLAASDSYAICVSPNVASAGVSFLSASMCVYFTPLNTGVNTFQVKYRAVKSDPTGIISVRPPVISVLPL